VRVGLNLATNDYRLIPIFNGSPPPPPTSLLSLNAPVSVVDESAVVTEIWNTTVYLAKLEIPTEAPPAFLLDAKRMTGHRVLTRERFDNRWIVFPQDFPSAQFFWSHGIRRILLIQESDGRPQDDLSYVLLRWQAAGMEIFLLTPESGPPKKINVARQALLRSLWYRLRSFARLRGSGSGGFGPYSIADWLSHG
jgi:hypothetical protein